MIFIVLLTVFLLMLKPNEQGAGTKSFILNCLLSCYFEAFAFVKFP